MFFFSADYQFNEEIKNNTINGEIINKNNKILNVQFNYTNVVMSSSVAITISSITLVVLLFMFMNKEWLSMGTILVQSLFSY